MNEHFLRNNIELKELTQSVFVIYKRGKAQQKEIQLLKIERKNTVRNLFKYRRAYNNTS